MKLSKAAGVMILASSRERTPNNEGSSLKVFDSAIPLTRINIEKIPRPVCCNFLVCFTLEQACGWEQTAVEEWNPSLWRHVCPVLTVQLVLDPYENHRHSCFANPLLKRKSKGHDKGCTLEAGSERTSWTFGGRRACRKQRTIPRTEPGVVRAGLARDASWP